LHLKVVTFFLGLVFLSVLDVMVCPLMVIVRTALNRD